jgi:hypothetical protein
MKVYRGNTAIMMNSFTGINRQKATLHNWLPTTPTTISPQFKQKLIQCLACVTLEDKDLLIKFVCDYSGNTALCLYTILSALDTGGYSFSGSLQKIWKVLQMCTEETIASTEIAKFIHTHPEIDQPNFSFKLNDKAISLAETSVTANANLTYFANPTALVQPNLLPLSNLNLVAPTNWAYLANSIALAKQAQQQSYTRIYPTVQYLHSETETSYKKLHTSETSYVTHPSQENALQTQASKNYPAVEELIKDNCKQLSLLKTQLENIQAVSEDSQESKALVYRLAQQWQTNFQAIKHYRQNPNYKYDYNFYAGILKSSLAIKKLTPEIEMLSRDLPTQSGDDKPNPESQLAISPSLPQRIVHDDGFVIEFTPQLLTEIQQRMAKFSAEYPTIATMPLEGLTTEAQLAKQHETVSNNHKLNGTIETTPSQAVPLSSETTQVMIRKSSDLPKDVIKDVIAQVSLVMIEHALQSQPLKLENFLLVHHLKAKHDHKIIFNKIVEETLLEYGNRNKIQYTIKPKFSQLSDNVLRNNNELLLVNNFEWLKLHQPQLVATPFTIVDSEAELQRTLERTNFAKYLKMVKELIQAHLKTQSLKRQHKKITGTTLLLDLINSKVISEQLLDYPIITLQCLMKLKETNRTYLKDKVRNKALIQDLTLG